LKAKIAVQSDCTFVPAPDVEPLPVGAKAKLSLDE
jgi:hypothetical protein